MLKDDASNQRETERWHILSPVPTPNVGRRALCGSDNNASVFDGPNEVYRAHVEGWHRIGLPCKHCVEVFLIAIKVNEEETENANT